MQKQKQNKKTTKGHKEKEQKPEVEMPNSSISA